MWSTPRLSKIGGENIEDFVKNSIRNILHANIDVHSIILFADLPGDGVKCIEKLQSHCAKMTFAEKLGMAEISSK